MQKIIINNKDYGSIEIPETKNAKKIFQRLLTVWEKRQPLHIGYLFTRKRQHELKSYQKGGAHDELAELQMFIDLGEKLNFNTKKAQELKEKIEHINDNAHVNLNISKRLQLFNKKTKSKTSKSYLFWDIENFSNVGPMFSHIIEPFEIEDEHIYVSANPDSLYLFKREWEADLYDFGKTLNSFNFTKCDHGKNVADTVLLEDFKTLKLHNATIYLITYDREFKELFKESCHNSNNLYIIGK